MGIEDMAGQAVDAVADQAKNIVPDEHADKVDQAADLAKGLIDKATGGGQA